MTVGEVLFWTFIGAPAAVTVGGWVVYALLGGE